MRTRLKLLTVGVVLVTAAVAGCSSTEASSGAVQNDTPASSAASPAASPPLLGGTYNSVCNTGLAYSCGQMGPGGGMVFYAVSHAFSLSNGYTTATCGTNNCHYMEAQLALLPGMAWCVGKGATTSVSPGTGAAIGTGYSNTQTMSGYCSSGAANTAIASTSGGYTDWFVPSADEGDALAWQWEHITGGAGCWNSSQTGAKQAYEMRHFGNSPIEVNKTSNNVPVCLVRAF